MTPVMHLTCTTDKTGEMMPARKNTNSKPKAQSKQAAEKQEAALKPQAAKQSKNTPRKRSPTSGSWVKGQSGNPKGRAKKGNAWADIIREVMEAKSVFVRYDTLDHEGKLKKVDIKLNAVGRQRNIRQLIVANMIEKALTAGDTTSLKLLMEHEVGKPPVLNMNANMTPEDLPDLKKGEDPVAALLARFAQKQ